MRIQIILTALFHLLLFFLFELLVQVFALFHFFHIEQLFHALEVCLNALAEYGLDLQLFGNDILLILQLMIVRPILPFKVLVIYKRIGLATELKFCILYIHLHLLVNLANDLRFLLDNNFLLCLLLHFLRFLLVFIKLSLLIQLVFFKFCNALFRPRQLLQNFIVFQLHF